MFLLVGFCSVFFLFFRKHCSSILQHHSIYRVHHFHCYLAINHWSCFQSKKAKQGWKSNSRIGCWLAAPQLVSTDHIYVTSSIGIFSLNSSLVSKWLVPPGKNLDTPLQLLPPRTNPCVFYTLDNTAVMYFTSRLLTHRNSLGSPADFGNSSIAHTNKLIKQKWSLEGEK